MPKYKRIILKLSGETLAPAKNGAQGGCFDASRVLSVASMVESLVQSGVQPGIVLGGGNIWRGRLSRDMDPVNADQMGMLATVINALCLSDALTRKGIENTVFSAQEMNRFTKLYTAADADRCLSGGGVALLSGGTGNPFFTTDTGAALRAAELRCDAVFKGTTVRGVYDKDPNRYPDAQFIPEISFDACIARGIRVMDTAAFQLCREKGVGAIRVFAMDDLQNVLRVAMGEDIGTTVR